MEYLNFFYFKNLGLPLIKFTRSIDGSTGTAIFLFKNIKGFEYLKESSSPLYKIFLKDNKNILFSKKIKIFFKHGKPKMLLLMFVLKNNYDWKVINSYIEPLILNYKLKFFFYDI